MDLNQLSFASRITRTQLPAGATLLVVENAASRTIALHGSLRAGSHFEPQDKPGLARLTAGMLERGTRRRSKMEIAAALEATGAELDFSVDPFAVNISARLLADDLPLVLSTIAEELREPAFPADEFEKLKQQTIAAIQEDQSDTGHRAYERFTQLIFDRSNPFFCHSGEQLIDSINSLTVDDLRVFHAARYGGGSLILAVAGRTEAAQATQIFAERFGDFAGPPDSFEVAVVDAAPLRECALREAVHVKGKANVDVLMGTAAALRRSGEDYYAALLANNALGESTLSSRLGLVVRDREGLTYGIGSRFSAPSLAAGPWYIAVSVNPQNVERAVASTLEVLHDYIEHGITEQELSDGKSSAIGTFKVQLSTNAGLAEALWNGEFFGLGTDYVDRFPQIVRAVTREEVNAAIRKYFRPDRLTVVVAGEVSIAA